jgi:hypothetical protein
MFDFLSDLVSNQLQSGLKRALRPLGPYLRMLTTGMLVMLSSIFLWALSLFALAMALFFKLSNLGNFVAPALAIFVIAGVLAGFLVFVGSRLLRMPR